MKNDLDYMSATSLIAHYRSGDLSPLQVMEHTLAQIRKVEPVINGFQLVDEDVAMAGAELSDARWKAGSPCGLLDGVPVSIKDIVLTKGWPTLSGSKLTDPSGAWLEDAPAVKSLRDAGAVLFGKTTTPEFGWKGMTDSPLKGITRNPWDTERTPGGSSGGAAASIAAGVGPLALGTDGGGSIRIPASFCGLYGIKPTFGRVPGYPMKSPFSTVSTAGPIARNVSDVALMLNAIAQPDHRDWHALPADGMDYLAGLNDGIEGLRIAFNLTLGEAEVSSEVEAAVRSAIKLLQNAGAEVEEIPPVVSGLKDDFKCLWLLGFSRTLKTLSEEKQSLLDPGLLALAQQGLQFDLEDYLAAETARIRLGETFSNLHAKYDLFVTPTMPVTAPSVNVKYASPENDRWKHGAPFTLPFNLTGQPAASVPCGISSAGLPIGLQIVGPKYSDALVLRAARAFEREFAFEWDSVFADEHLKSLA